MNVTSDYHFVLLGPVYIGNKNDLLNRFWFPLLTKTLHRYVFLSGCKFVNSMPARQALLGLVQQALFGPGTH